MGGEIRSLFRGGKGGLSLGARGPIGRRRGRGLALIRQGRRSSIGWGVRCSRVKRPPNRKGGFGPQRHLCHYRVITFRRFRGEKPEGPVGPARLSLSFFSFFFNRLAIGAGEGNRTLDTQLGKLMIRFADHKEIGHFRRFSSLLLGSVLVEVMTRSLLDFGGVMEQKISIRQIEAYRRSAARSGRDLFVWDTELKGFGLKATAKGHISWIVQKWIGGRGGKAKRIVIGHCPPMKADEARAEAEIIIGDLRKEVDVVGLREQKRRAQREVLQALNLQECVEAYFKKRAEPGRYWKELRVRFDKEVISKLGKTKPIVSITKADVRALLDEKEGYPGAARTLYVGLAPFFKWCVEKDYLEVSPMATLARPGPAASRDRTLSDTELKAFWRAASREALFGPFYKLLLLTAQRREEVAGMRWSELEKEIWIIPRERTKNDKAHIVHLSAQAREIVDGLPRRDSAFVFTTTLKSSITGYGKAKARLNELMKEELGELKPWRLHDLRRTAASGMAQLGFAPHVIDRVLNHVSPQSGVTGIYQRYEYLKERKAALCAWGAHLEDVLRIANVVLENMPVQRAEKTHRSLIVR